MFPACHDVFPACLNMFLACLDGSPAWHGSNSTWHIPSLTWIIPTLTWLDNFPVWHGLFLMWLYIFPELFFLFPIWLDMFLARLNPTFLIPVCAGPHLWSRKIGILTIDFLCKVTFQVSHLAQTCSMRKSVPSFWPMSAIILVSGTNIYRSALILVSGTNNSEWS